MESDDRLEAQKVWKQTKGIISDGNIVKSIINGRRNKFSLKKNFRYLPCSPSCKKMQNTYKLPVKDKVSNLDNYTKHCFWLNSNFVRDKIYNV